MVIKFENKKFKSKKERNKFCYENLKKLKEKYKNYEWGKQVGIIIIGVIIILGFICITNSVIFVLALFGFMGYMVLGYKNKKIQEIISFAEDYEANYQKEIKEDKERKERTVHEYERRCNRCGRKWHSLKSEEDSLNRSSVINSLAGLGTAVGGNLSASAQANRNAQSSDNRLKDFKKCPKCGSQNYSEKITSFEKNK